MMSTWKSVVVLPALLFLIGCHSPHSPQVMTGVASDATVVGAEGRTPTPVRGEVQVGIDRTLLESQDLRALGHQILWSSRVRVFSGGMVDHLAIFGDLIVSVDARNRLVSGHRLADGRMLWQTRVSRPGELIYEPGFATTSQEIQRTVYSIAVDQLNEADGMIRQVFVESFATIRLEDGVLRFQVPHFFREPDGRTSVSWMDVTDRDEIDRLKEEFERLTSLFRQDPSVYRTHQEREMRQESMVVVNTERQIISINPETGEILRVDELPHRVRHGPRISAGKAVFTNLSGIVFAHDLTKRRTVWRWAMDAQIRIPPVVMDEDRMVPSVFVADEAGDYRLLRVRQGGRFDSQTMWLGRFFDGVSAEPVEHGDNLLIPSMDTKLYALNRLSGEETWAVNTGQRLNHRPIVLGDVVYLRVGSDHYWAIDSRNGRVLWRGMLPGELVGTFEEFLLCRQEGFMTLHDVETGGLVDDFPVRDMNRFIRVNADRFLLASDAGRLMLIERMR